MILNWVKHNRKLLKAGNWLPNGWRCMRGWWICERRVKGRIGMRKRLSLIFFYNDTKACRSLLSMTSEKTLFILGLISTWVFRQVTISSHEASISRLFTMTLPVMRSENHLQSGRTFWRVASLCGERKTLMAFRPFMPEAGKSVIRKQGH